MEKYKTIFTGGSGLLGSEFKKLRPDFLYPHSYELDVFNYDQVKRYIKTHGCSRIVHAAAKTKPPTVNKDPIPALQTNIIGTANLVEIAMTYNIYFVYISTDYVFDGQKGMYTEWDGLNPVNKYAWSKLGGECAVKMHDRSLIIRTTFGPNVFPYNSAFTDQWTSRESVSIIADKINKILDKELTGVIHIGGDRKTVYEYATRLDSSREIGKMSIEDMPVKMPKDTSLNTEFYDNLKL